MAMMKPLDVPALGLSDEEAEVEFEKLQAVEQVSAVALRIPGSCLEFINDRSHPGNWGGHRQLHLFSSKSYVLGISWIDSWQPSLGGFLLSGGQSAVEFQT